MAIMYSLIGFNQYLIIDKILYREAYKVKCKLYKWKYYKQRKIKICIKDNQKGYYLCKNNKLKFYSLQKLKHRLKFIK